MEGFHTFRLLVELIVCHDQYNIIAHRSAALILLFLIVMDTCNTLSDPGLGILVSVWSALVTAGSKKESWIREGNLPCWSSSALLPTCYSL